MKWSKLEPSEFYFYTGPVLCDTDRECYGIQSWTVICPKSWFDDLGYIIDLYLDIDIHLPEYMSEDGRALFASNRSPEETKQELLKRGFSESDRFTNFCSTHDPFVE